MISNSAHAGSERLLPGRRHRRARHSPRHVPGSCFGARDAAAASIYAPQVTNRANWAGKKRRFDPALLVEPAAYGIFLQTSGKSISLAPSEFR